jgi:transposase
VNEPTPAVKIKRRRSRAEIEQLVAEYEASGLGRTAFCQQRGLSLSTLARYRRRQEQTVGEGAEGKCWLAVEVSGSAAVGGGERASGLAVVLPGGRRIAVGRGFDADTLQRLLAVVERGRACLV